LSRGDFRASSPHCDIERKPGTQNPRPVCIFGIFFVRAALCQTRRSLLRRHGQAANQDHAACARTADGSPTALDGARDADAARSVSRVQPTISAKRLVRGTSAAPDDGARAEVELVQRLFGPRQASAFHRTRTWLEIGRKGDRWGTGRGTTAALEMTVSGAAGLVAFVLGDGARAVADATEALWGPISARRCALGVSG